MNPLPLVHPLSNDGPVGSYGLLSLPNELLHKIFSDRSVLHPAELYGLATLCRRLHAISLPLFFAHYGPIGSDEFTYLQFFGRGQSMGPDEVSGLFISFSPIPRIEKLSIWIPRRTKHWRTTLSQLHRASDLMTRVSSLGTVRIRFEDLSVPTRGDDLILSEWSLALGSLLKIILDRSCASLAVIGGRYLIHSYEIGRQSSNGLLRAIRRTNKSQKLDVILNAAIRESGWEYRRPANQGRSIALPELSLTSPAQSLHELSISSVILLTPPALQWTLSVLQTCPITSLIIHFPSNPQDIRWNVILPTFANVLQGKLRRLNMKHCSISSTDALALLSTSPALSRIIINLNDVPPLTPSPVLTFSSLTTLNATLRWMSLLLSFSQPALRYVTLYTASLSMLVPPPATVAHVVVSVLEGVSRLSSLETFTLDANRRYIPESVPAPEGSRHHPSPGGKQAWVLKSEMEMKAHLRGLERAWSDHTTSQQIEAFARGLYFHAPWIRVMFSDDRANAIGDEGY